MAKYVMVCILELAKWDLWGLGAESWFVVRSYDLTKMIPPIGGSFWLKLISENWAKNFSLAVSHNFISKNITAPFEISKKVQFCLLIVLHFAITGYP